MKTGLDLTEGRISSGLLRYSIPLMLANVLQCLYSTADIIILGRLVGNAGLAAASVGGELIVVITAASTGLTLGGTVVIAQHFGGKDLLGVGHAASSLFHLFAAFGIVLTALSLPLVRPVLVLLNTPSEIMTEAVTYLRISCIGIIPIFGYNCICSILRGIGDSKRPLIIVGATSVMNIILDLIFVGPLHMGAGGAAIATCISQSVSFIVAFIVLFVFRKDCVQIKSGEFRYYKNLGRNILRVGIPNMVQVVVIHVSVVIVLGMVNSLGLVAAAAFSVGCKIDNFYRLPRQALGHGMSAMIGQNAGAGKQTRIRKIVRTGIVINLAVGSAILVLVQLFAEPLMHLFTNDPEVVAEGILYLRIATFSSIPCAVMTAYNALPIGLGVSEFSLLNSFLDSIVARISFCWLFCFALSMGTKGIYLGLALCPIVAAISGFCYFHFAKWSRRVKPIESQ